MARFTTPSPPIEQWQSRAAHPSCAARLCASLALLLLATGCLHDPIPPVAEAGPALQGVAGQSVTLDGSCSFDPDQGTIRLPSESPCDPATGAIASYQWRIIQAPATRTAEIGRLIAPPSSNPTLNWQTTPADVGPWLLELQVSDNDGRRATDVVTVTLTHP
jgi:hypothetical protein